MLHQVIEYAARQELAAEPGFSPKNVLWAILCNASGQYLGVVELGDAELKKNPGRSFPKAPDLSQPEMKAGGILKSHFLIDTAAVVALYGKDALKEKHEYFINLMEAASASTPSLSAAAAMLRSEEQLNRLRFDLEQRKAKPTDKITFQIGGQFPVDSESWHQWWRSFRRSLPTGKSRTRQRDASNMLCFLTGQRIEPAATHPKINGLTSVGGLAMGDVLVGFKQESFRSYGLEQSSNAAMSEAAAKSYQAGLNHLIATRSVLLAGTLVVHWFRSDVSPADDLLDLILKSGGDEAQNAAIRARELLNSIRSGDRADLAKNTYFALTISSNGGRVVIRDWMEGSFEHLTANIDAWFSDLEIVHRDGRGSAPAPKLAAILAGTVRDLKDVAAPMAAKLYRVAVRGEPIPLATLTQALARVRVDTIQGERPNHARMGLIKAYHLRKWKREGAQTVERPLKPELNGDFENPAYQCGRLMAVLGRLQNAALGDVGAGVIQRYYAAASTTPALVFGRLIRGAQPHLSKLGDQKGLQIWYERQMSEICSRIGTAMPATLNLEDQSLFALGYYQQLAAMRTGKSKEINEEDQQ